MNKDKKRKIELAIIKLKDGEECYCNRGGECNVGRCEHRTPHPYNEGCEESICDTYHQPARCI